MITHIGNNLIWYKYDGDEIAWNGEAYLSTSFFLQSFASLEELGRFWNDYFKALSK
jgi:hypothetical protein